MRRTAGEVEAAFHAAGTALDGFLRAILETGELQDLCDTLFQFRPAQRPCAPPQYARFSTAVRSSYNAQSCQTMPMEPPACRALADHVVAVRLNPACSRCPEAGDARAGRGFPGPIWPQQSEDSPGLRRESRVIHGGDLTINFAQVLDLDHQGFSSCNSGVPPATVTTGFCFRVVDEPFSAQWKPVPSS